jgi:hypothetical protein
MTVISSCVTGGQVLYLPHKEQIVNDVLRYKGWLLQASLQTRKHTASEEHLDVETRWFLEIPGYSQEQRKHWEECRWEGIMEGPVPGKGTVCQL